MKCRFCNHIIYKHCSSCNVDYYDVYYYIYYIHNDKRYVCKKFIDSTETSFYIDELFDGIWDENPDVSITLDNVNITPSNIKDFVEKKLKTLMVFK